MCFLFLFSFSSEIDSGAATAYTVNRKKRKKEQHFSGIWCRDVKVSLMRDIFIFIYLNSSRTLRSLRRTKYASVNSEHDI